jgi:hypothetical protein
MPAPTMMARLAARACALRTIGPRSSNRPSAAAEGSTAARGDRNITTPEDAASRVKRAPQVSYLASWLLVVAHVLA